MNSYGIRGNLLAWLKNYLHGRKQKVVIRDSSSPLSGASTDVAQVSVLGFLLFLIYINDIGETLLSLTRLFTDDTSLRYSSSSPDTLELLVSHDLNKLSTWSEKWLMSFNPDKTKIMICSNMEIPNNLNISFNGKLISNSSSHKHLGVTLYHEVKCS
jgi:hypothetical protein